VFVRVTEQERRRKINRERDRQTDSQADIMKERAVD
jgi:hypothetical protein